MGTDEQKQDIRLNQWGHLASDRNAQQLNVSWIVNLAVFEGRKMSLPWEICIIDRRSSQAKPSIKSFIQKSAEVVVVKKSL